MKKRLLTFCLIVIAAGSALLPVEAAKWVQISESASVNVYIDIDSIAGGSMGPRDAWVRIDLKTPDCDSVAAKSMNNCIASAQTRERYFADKTFCNLQAVFNFADGTNWQMDYKCEPDKVRPVSLSAEVWKFLYPKNN